MSPILRHPVISAQRHPVTEIRQYSYMTVGDRIKERLSELNQDVKWLHSRTHIPVSSLYEIMNGRMKSTPRLPTIAAALGLRALWLERKTGPRLVNDTDDHPIADSQWPFRFARSRWDQLPPPQRKKIEGVVEELLRAYEAGNLPAAAKSRATRKAG
jgi:hypothetical protein